MKAIICPKYGSPDVLQLREVVKPVPQEDEVLIQIHAASLNSRDLTNAAGETNFYATEARRSFPSQKQDSRG